jgi:hypothetical protein
MKPQLGVRESASRSVSENRVSWTHISALLSHWIESVVVRQRSRKGFGRINGALRSLVSLERDAEDQVLRVH